MDIPIKLLTRDDILGELRRVYLHHKQYWVGFGSALCLYGIRMTTSDIDIGCLPGYFNHLIESGHVVNTTRYGNRMITISPFIEIYEEILEPPTVTVDSKIRVTSLQYIREQKVKLGRPKDLADIKAIDEYILTHGNS